MAVNFAKLPNTSSIMRSTTLPPVVAAQRYLARARQFRRVAIELPDMDGPEPNWPKWFLVTHAIVLAIKAFIVSREDDRRGSMTSRIV